MSTVEADVASPMQQSEVQRMVVAGKAAAHAATVPTKQLRAAAGAGASWKAGEWPQARRACYLRIGDAGGQEAAGGVECPQAAAVT